MNISEIIIEKCKANDREAQRKVFDALLPPLRAIVRRYLMDVSYTDDMLQEIFVKIFQNLSQFDSQKGTLLSWSTRLSINHVINFNHKKAKNDFKETNSEAGVQTGIIEPMAYSNLSNEELLRFLKTMPTSSYEVLNLHAIQGYSHEEIASMLNISISNSRKILSRARQWLRDKGLEPKQTKQNINFS